MFHILAQNDAGAQQVGGAAFLGGFCFFFIIYIAILAVVIAGMWKAFAKAGKPGWGSLIPIYNIILMLEMAGRPVWWIILFLIPLANLVVAILVSLDIARKFHKSSAFGLGLVFLAPIFWCILGFGDAQFDASA